MHLTSIDFHTDGFIPSRFTCEGDDVNPTLIIGGVPDRAQSLALIVDDPDAPGKTFVHWVLYDIPIVHRIEEDSAPGVGGVNDFGHTNYGGPCPPRALCTLSG